MEISQATAGNQATVQVDAMKKSIDTQEQQVLKVLESVSEESKQTTAQKTGMGSQLNIIG